MVLSGGSETPHGRSEMAKDESGESVFAGCLLVVIGAIVAVPMKLFVLFKLWGWFVLPTFGVTAPSNAMAFGLLMVFALSSSTRGSRVDPDSSLLSDGLREIVVSTFGPLCVLFAGWVAMQLAQGGY
jgi:hypothetical protein